MSDLGSDSFSGLEFPEFTEEDFAQIDANIASQIVRDEEPADESFRSEIYGLNLNLLTEEELAKFDVVGTETDAESQHDPQENETANSSFQYANGDLNLGTLSAAEFASLDAAMTEIYGELQAGPSIEIAIETPREPLASPTHPQLQQEDASNEVPKPHNRKTPLQEFRSHMSLSVTDLVSPSWYVECPSSCNVKLIG